MLCPPVKLLLDDGSKWFPSMSLTWEDSYPPPAFSTGVGKALPGEPVKLPRCWLSLWRQKVRAGKGARGSCCSPKGSAKMSTEKRKQEGRIREKLG